MNHSHRSRCRCSCGDVAGIPASRRDQPLDYDHHGGRPWPRSLAAFLATAVVEATDGPEVLARFRYAVLDASWTVRPDCEQPEVVVVVAARGPEEDRPAIHFGTDDLEAEDAPVGRDRDVRVADP